MGKDEWEIVSAVATAAATVVALFFGLHAIISGKSKQLAEANIIAATLLVEVFNNSVVLTQLYNFLQLNDENQREAVIYTLINRPPELQKFSDFESRLRHPILEASIPRLGILPAKVSRPITAWIAEFYTLKSTMSQSASSSVGSGYQHDVLAASFHNIELSVIESNNALDALMKHLEGPWWRRLLGRKITNRVPSAIAKSIIESQPALASLQLPR